MSWATNAGLTRRGRPTFDCEDRGRGGRRDTSFEIAYGPVEMAPGFCARETLEMLLDRGDSVPDAPPGFECWPMSVGEWVDLVITGWQAMARESDLELLQLPVHAGPPPPVPVSDSLSTAGSRPERAAASRTPSRSRSPTGRARNNELDEEAEPASLLSLGQGEVWRPEEDDVMVLMDSGRGSGRSRVRTDSREPDPLCYSRDPPPPPYAGPQEWSD